MPKNKIKTTFQLNVQYNMQILGGFKKIFVGHNMQ